MTDNIYYIFNEPHPTGGDSSVRISRSKAIQWMRKSKSERFQEVMKTLSDDEIIEEFCVLHGAWQLPEQVKRYNLLQNDYLNSQNTVERMKDRILSLGGTYDDLVSNEDTSNKEMAQWNGLERHDESK